VILRCLITFQKADNFLFFNITLSFWYLLFTERSTHCLPLRQNTFLIYLYVSYTAPARGLLLSFQSRHHNHLRSRRWLSSGHQYGFGLLQCFCLHPVSSLSSFASHVRICRIACCEGYRDMRWYTAGCPICL